MTNKTIFKRVNFKPWNGYIALKDLADDNLPPFFRLIPDESGTTAEYTETNADGDEDVEIANDQVPGPDETANNQRIIDWLAEAAFSTKLPV